MNSQWIAALKRHYAFEAWHDKSAMAESVFVWKFLLDGVELPGWRAQTIRTIGTGPGTTPISSLWKPTEGGDDTSLRLDVAECGSRQEAHELLLQELGQFQSTTLSQEKEATVGDVAFVARGDTDMFFARGNLVVHVFNAGRRVVPVVDIARKFDEELVKKPETGVATVVPQIQRFASPTKDLTVKGRAALEVDAIDPLQRSVWYKFYCCSGEVLAKEGRLQYRPATAGPQEVTVFAINANRGAASEVLRLVASQDA
jgi:hypothetical protein